ncbi:cas scaffolding protein family member 4 isoform X1 [Camarhynchus parvulus]|uniref:Cas scaffold protein family member 4 n=1 Tax=Geospiza parvula TaxID=87175 RepID=A0A8C3MDV6_GEOPR|nr:cas scaffolding protein family member 4 isoform X1 [Camarhynchus parvulus]
MTTMDKNPRSSTSAKHSLAKALYDNKAECSDELAFRRGDIVTVLEQHVAGSQGWWHCSLHGHHGLAPANRLQLLPPSTEPPAAHSIYQVPSVPSVPTATAPSATYEKMEGWVQPQLVYQVPALAAQLLSERPKRSTHQHLFTLPRACRASAPNIRGEVYDVPSSQHRGSPLPQSAATPPSTRKVSMLGRSTESFQAEQKQLYNIPSKAEKGGAGSQDSAAGNLYDVPPKRELNDSENKSQKKFWGHYNTLPNPRKSEWIYDIPVSPENSGFKPTPPGQPVEKQVLYDIPPGRYKAPAEAKAGNPQLYDIPPAQRKLTLPEIPLYDVPPSRDALLLPQNGSSELPPRLLAAKAESQISEENVYDIPKGLPSAGHCKKEVENNSNQAHGASPQLSMDAKSENDSLCVSSVDSRSSTLSSSSSSSAESFSRLSQSPEPVQEIKLELEAAIEALTRLQHGVSSSIASLMIFVSSKWRLQEHLEKSLEEIHRAVDHIKVSLGEFLAFAQALKGNASNLTDNNLQARINKQLEILMNSYKILTETREALNSCSWSLEALVLRKPQSNPDDLDRFVMVARTIPDDIKRFVSIIIANGKLLFRKNEKEQEKKQPKVNPECKMAKQIPVPRRVEIESLQRNAPEKPSQSQVPVQKPEENCSEDCDYVQLQVLPCAKKTENASRQEPARRIALPEHCRLCFAALHKALGVFSASLSSQQPPEIFISHSKLIIMVGQRLVDSLCQQSQESEARSDILHSSSRFCSLLKNLALATKSAALKFPNAEASRELREQAEQLAQYTQQFRAMMD